MAAQRYLGIVLHATLERLGQELHRLRGVRRRLAQRRKELVEVLVAVDKAEGWW